MPAAAAAKKVGISKGNNKRAGHCGVPLTQPEEGRRQQPLGGLPVAVRAGIIVAALAAGVLNGVSNGVTNVLEQIQVQNGYDSQVVTVSGLLYLVPCIPAPWLFGMLMDATLRRAALVASLLFVATAILQAGLLLTAKSLTAFYVVICLYGITTTGLTTVLLAFVNKWIVHRDSLRLNTLYAGSTASSPSSRPCFLPCCRSSKAPMPFTSSPPSAVLRLFHSSSCDNTKTTAFKSTAFKACK